VGVSAADYVILGLVGLSATVSLLRGFVREALSLAGWVLAFWVALTFTREVAAVLPPSISVPSARLAVGFLALFFGTLLVTALVNFLAAQLVERTGLSGRDRLLGVVFGVARGAVIVAILVLLAGFTALPQDPWWRASALLPHFQQMALWTRGFLPPDLAAQIRY
jgi:membrane protein required for colicin V production